VEGEEVRRIEEISEWVYDVELWRKEERWCGWWMVEDKTL
jgi:hypothetical protein